MPPSFDFGDWLGAKDAHRGTPVVVKMENPNWSMLELQSPTKAGVFEADKKRDKNAKQLTWVLMLKAHRAAGCLAWLAMGAWTILAAVKKRLIFQEGVAPSSTLDKPSKGRLFHCIRTFLFFSIIMLAVEIVAYFQGWHFSRPHLRVPTVTEVQSFPHVLYLSWVYLRQNYIAPPLQLLADICIVLFLIQSADRLLLCLGCMWIKYKGIKPVAKVETFQTDDLENPDAAYPKVLVQIPMCNEREVYQQSLAAVCQLEWPRSRFLVQVLDDSDDATTQELIKAEVQKWSLKGVHTVYRHRVNRVGYKAGNLKAGMLCDYVKNYDYVAIFDADFQPQSDFLKRTVPHFIDNPELGLVQTRWSFINRDENLLTRLQNINLSFHFEVEQQVNGVFLSFFGFNGTAGVWRIKALEDAGGWLERTTVEDMDVAVRAHLQGWKFIFLNDVKCICELPESYEAYRKQQHRWHSGPMQLFRLCLPDIITAPISIWKKSNLVFLFFLLRKLVLPFYSFTLFCIILPMTMFVPEAHLPVWVICYVPAIMSFLNVLPAPKSFPFLVPYLLFENTMSVTKFNAMVSGLFQLGSAYEWVVTKKMGRSSEADLLAIAQKETEEEASLPLAGHRRGASEWNLEGLAKDAQEVAEPNPVPFLKKKKTNRLYRKELTLSLLLLTASARSLLSAKGVHFYFLLFQGLAFLAVGLDLIGEQVS